MGALSIFKVQHARRPHEQGRRYVPGVSGIHSARLTIRAAIYPIAKQTGSRPCDETKGKEKKNSLSLGQAALLSNSWAPHFSFFLKKRGHFSRIKEHADEVRVRRVNII